MPDLEKVLQLAQIFGVSCDFLLRDDGEETPEVPAQASSVRRVSMKEAQVFLQVKEQTARPIALATFLCILSPIGLILLSTASETGMWPLSENVAGGVGLILLLLVVAVAVALFISCGIKTSPFSYLETEIFETESSVLDLVRERQKAYRPTYTRYNILGACTCILSVIPLFAGAFLTQNEFFLVTLLTFTLLIAGIGVMFFIVAGIHWASLQKLLQEGDYTRQKKKSASLTGTISVVYWLLITAAYIAYNLPTQNWKTSWVIWPVAAVLYAALMVVLNSLSERKK